MQTGAGARASAKRRGGGNEGGQKVRFAGQEAEEGAAKKRARRMTKTVSDEGEGAVRQGGHAARGVARREEAGAWWEDTSVMGRGGLG